MHLDASAIEQADGTAVLSWSSDAEPAPDAEQTLAAVPVTEAQAPVLVEGAINGVAAVRFDGTDDRLQLSDNPFAPDSLPRTVFSVISTSDYRGHIIGTGSATAGQLTSHGYAIGVAAHKPFLKAKENNIGSWLLSPANVRQTDPMVVGALATSTNSEIVSNCHRVQTDTTPMAAGLENAFIGGTIQNEETGDPVESEESFAGDIAEVLVYDRELTVEEYRSMRDYLNGRYGIAAPAMMDTDGDGVFDDCDTGAIYIPTDAITVTLEQPDPEALNGSTANMIDALSALSFDPHSAETHVYAAASDIVALFEFDGVYNIEQLHLWNYNGEDDVDSLTARFFNAAGEVVQELTVEPNVGFERILAEDFAVNADAVSSVRVEMSGSNGSSEIQNIGFTGVPVQ